MSATGRIMPPPLVELLQRQRADLLARPELASGLAQLPQPQLDNTLIASDFVVAEWLNHPQSLQWLADLGLQMFAFTREEIADELSAESQGCESEEALGRILRCFRNRHMVRLIWCDANNLISLAALTAQLSWLAQLLVEAALQWAYQHIADKGYGFPVGKQSQQRQKLVVLGMGKLGAQELNLSSDIDLIFVFPEEGHTNGSKPLDNQEFFAKTGKKLIQLIDRQTVDGFVFRVDMRLRPSGSSGPLALSFSAARHYYERVGRDWERYALIKAQTIAGDIEQGAVFIRSMRPFVYRRYLDFTVMESIREMKQLINREVKRQGNENNIKVGYGGIREVEFVVQSLQLIYGGKEPALQRQNFNAALIALYEYQYISGDAYQQLLESYQFLRRLEHGLQAIADKQTQLLPNDELTQQRVAWVLGFSDWSELLTKLAQVRERVREHFEQLIFQDDTAPAGQNRPEADDQWLLFWQQLTEQTRPQEGLLPESCERALQQFLLSSQVSRMTKRGRQRLDHVMPMMLELVALQPETEMVLARALGFLEATAQRPVYMALLLENPASIASLVSLVAQSPWLAELLTAYPLLVQELLDGKSVYQPPPAADLSDELNQQLLRIPEDDEEQLLECLGQFKHAHVLRLAAAELSGNLPLMQGSDYLTWLAQAVVQHAMELAQHSLLAKHGYPCNAQGEAQSPEFMVVGYGKLGGIELDYSSDLDLVFFYDAPAQQLTDGAKPIDNERFYTRLAQRLIHVLTTRTQMGRLYEVDPRLRPEGSKGLLVISPDSFKRYQQSQAWIWEHQALVRARPVAGNKSLFAHFEQIREVILCQPRDHAALAREVQSMRQKMQKQLGSYPNSNVFDLKQDKGGIVDIEFMVQYGVLAWANQYPQLIRYTDNERLLGQFAELGLIARADAEFLQQTYLVYRQWARSQTLSKQSSLVASTLFEAERERVSQIWAYWFASTH